MRAYRAADLAGYEEASRELVALRTLLHERLAPDRLMTLSADEGEDLPHLPVYTELTQMLRARVAYVEASGLSGIAYLAVHSLDPSPYPFSVFDLAYTFQGLSTDGSWYVAVESQVEPGMLPREVSRRQAERVTRRWGAYLERTTRRLSEAVVDEFSPSLAALDALVGSITVQERAPSGSEDTRVGTSPSPPAG